MKISTVRIRNFRSVEELDLVLGETTVFVGQNDSGKTAIMDAIRIVLTRRWGRQGTGFTSNDVFRQDETDPRKLPPVQIEVTLEEASIGEWDPDMVADLDDIIGVLPDGRNTIILRVTSAWDAAVEDFVPKWEFLNPSGSPLTGKATRATNLTGFFGYLPVFWLGALRDAENEFAPRSVYWGRLLRGIKIPAELETEALSTLTALDAKLIAADPSLTAIADTIGLATHIAIGDAPGAARFHALPSSIEEMLSRAAIVIRNEDGRPWLPLDHHGQGLQSLAVIFLFQAVVLQQLKDSGRPGISALFALEEPEVHLHPQAARTLWPRVHALPGQRLATTHSPHFVQHVPLHDLRLVSLRSGKTVVSSLERYASSALPWTAQVESLAGGKGAGILAQDTASRTVRTVASVPEDVADALSQCYRKDTDAAARAVEVRALRRASRLLVSKDEEQELGFNGRRIRGEIFFARRWVLVEGVCEHLLLHALGDALGWPLDAHGVAVIDFQNCGSPGIYVTLAEALRIPWHMVTDADTQAAGFRRQILKRGFEDADLASRLTTLSVPNNLEDQLLADGHEKVLRDILAESIGPSAATLSLSDLKARLTNRKTDYMRRLAARVATDPILAKGMPAPFVALVTALRDGTT